MLLALFLIEGFNLVVNKKYVLCTFFIDFNSTLNLAIFNKIIMKEK